MLKQGPVVSKRRGPKRRIDADVYIAARVRGVPRVQAIRLAGSQATTDHALEVEASRLETSSGYLARVRRARDLVVQRIEDDFQAARARARECLDDPKLRRYWPEAWKFFARIGGHFAPDRMQLDVGGAVEVRHEHVHTVDTAWLSKLLKRAQEDGLLELLQGGTPPALEQGNGHEANGAANGEAKEADDGEA